MNPLFNLHQRAYRQWPAYALWADAMALWSATLCPGDLNPYSQGMCAPLPFIEHVIDFSKIKDIEPYFYLNAYNVTEERIENFTKDVITPEHFRCALAFPFIYGPYRMNSNLYYEGAVVDCLNFKDLVELHPGLEIIVVLDVLGSSTLVREPRNLYDSWVLSMIIPLVKTAEDNLDLFIYKHNKGVGSSGKTRELLKVEFDIPDKYLPEVLDWSASNAKRLFDVGYAAGRKFAKEHADKLNSGSVTPND